MNAPSPKPGAQLRLGLLALAVACHGQVDAPPPAATLTASPRRGGPPLAVSIAWLVDAGPGSALHCRLDYGGGAPPEEVTPCPPGGSRQHTYAQLGTFEPALTVTDQDGAAARARAEVVVEPAAGDLSIALVEWGQTVFSAAPRLVGQKPALLRIHVVSTDAGLGPIAVRGVATLDGGTLPLELTGPPVIPLAPVPEDVTQSFTAVLPPDWVQPGLHVDVRIDSDDAVAESDETNNIGSYDPVVGPATVLPLTLVPVVQKDLQPRTLPDPWFTTVWRHWPLAAITSRVRATYTFGGVLDSADVTGWQTLLDEIDGLRTADQSSDWYYGYAQVDYTSGLAGLGLVGEPAAIGRDDSERALTHELGHTFNLLHAPCGGASNPDPNYPYPGAEIGVWGWDLVFQRLVNPVTSLDVMSYCTPAWVSDYSYGRAQVHLEATAPALAARLGGATDGFLVHGHLEAAGTVVFQPVQRVRAAASEPADPGQRWRVRVESAAGAVEVVPRVAEVADTGGLRFSAVVPASVGAPSAIALVEGTRVRGRLARAALPPPRFAPRVTAVEGGVWVEWDALAAPVLAVTHVGDRRTVLGLGLRGGRAVLPTAGLPPGGALELSASDGVAPELHHLPRPEPQLPR